MIEDAVELKPRAGAVVLGRGHGNGDCGKVMATGLKTQPSWIHLQALCSCGEEAAIAVMVKVMATGLTTQPTWIHLLAMLSWTAIVGMVKARATLT